MDENMKKRLQPLKLGDLEIPIPIFQGGMGVKVSTAPLAAAVANCGAVGTLSSVGLGHGHPKHQEDYIGTSRAGLQEQIRNTKKMTNGVVGVNILFALHNYEDHVKTSVEEGADFIISGAGLPLKLPEYAEGSNIKLIPIVSGARAAEIVLKTWRKRYNKIADAVVVEGPLAGGHLGFSRQELSVPLDGVLETIMQDVLPVVKKYEEESGQKIPVIAAGGIFDGKDIAKFINLGASGVQMATRFVTTHECDVPEGLKDLYIKATKEDIQIIDSPVGLPGRAITTEMIRKVNAGEKIPISCTYQCLKTCKPREVSYCIAKALCNAVSADFDNSVLFAGSNVWKVKEKVSVKELIDTLVEETNIELNNFQGATS